MPSLSHENKFGFQDKESARRAHLHMKSCASKTRFETEEEGNLEVAYSNSDLFILSPKFILHVIGTIWPHCLLTIEGVGAITSYRIFG